MTPGYFSTLGIPLVEGRCIEARDGAQSGKVIVVNRTFVERYLSGSPPLGRRLAIASARREIVGVVGDVQQKPSFGRASPIGAVPTVFLPVQQMDDRFFSLIHTWFAPSFIVKTAARPETALAEIERAVRSVDPSLPVVSFKTMDSVRAGALDRERFQATLVGAFALLALVLAAVGVYGLVASGVHERTREIGIRLALGATVPQIIASVALPGILAATTGLLLGFLGAAGAGRLLSSFLWGVSPSDPVAYGAVALVVLVVAATASIVPSFRAARVSAAATLRAE